MPEIRISVTEKFKELINTKAEEIGTTEADYIRSLIIEDLKSKKFK